MTASWAPEIVIHGRRYRRNPAVDRYQVPFNELGDLRIREIPRQSHLEILDLPVPPEVNVNFYAVNGSSDTEPYYFVYGGPSIKCETREQAVRALAKMKRAFPNLDQNTTVNPFTVVGGTSAYAHVSLDFSQEGDVLVRRIFEDLVQQIAQLAKPSFHLFICHASEDKPKARSVARALKSLGTDVWLDEWEIRVGDSIVQKINQALSEVTHLVLLLSEASCTKPWVAKEWSAALMRQLADNSIVVLPVRLDDQPVPPIMADLRYADCRGSLRKGIAQLKQALAPQ